MKKTFLTILLITVGFTLNYAQTAPANGDGSSGNPYQIATFDNLLWIQADISRWDKHYIQTADILAEPYGSENWDRIGDAGDPFTGSYNGQGHTIAGLVIALDANNANYRGFFGAINGATLENITLTEVDITNESRVGALVGNSIGGTITNCHTAGTVSGSGSWVGGFIGMVAAGDATTITDCHSECVVTNSGGNTGGFLGSSENDNLTITNCYSTGNVTLTAEINNTSVGGFVGYLQGTVSKSYSTGDVVGGANGNWSPTGGFVGYNHGTISECYSRGNAEGYQRVGGFVGYNKTSSSVIENSYSFGNATRRGGDNVQIGGFAGYNRNSSGTPKIEKCYSVGSVTYSGATDPTDKGFVGENTGSLTDSFFDSEASNQTTDVAATAKNTTEMKTQETFESAGWDFGTIWEIIESTPSSASNNGLAKVNASGNYPRLQNQPDELLPVELTTFSAKLNGNKVKLSWSTATEVNNYGFSVERKPEIGDWSELGFVEGSGNSNSPKYYSYTDSEIGAGKYFYRLKQVDIDGSFEYSSIVEVDLTKPIKYELSQNFPNPFNPTTSIQFSLPKAGKVKLIVYNVIGEQVAVLVNKNMEAGFHNARFDAAKLNSGIYIYKLEVNNFTQIRKMMLIK